MKWTDENTTFLRANYSRMSNAELGAKLGCSANAARIKANRLGLHKPPVETMGLTKEARYILKCRAEGRCPHCGKPCAPYKQCEERREYERARAVDGRARRWSLKPQKHTKTPFGMIARVGHVTAHRML